MGVYQGCIWGVFTSFWGVFLKVGKKIGAGYCHRLLYIYFSRSANISSRLVTFSVLKSEVVCIFTVFSDK